MKLHLEPLVIATNVTQAAFFCLDTMLLTFGFLVMQYNQMTEDANDIASMSISPASRNVGQQQIKIFSLLLLF